MNTMDNILIAKDGYVYANGDTFGKVIRLGINDNADNWHEITDAEAQALQEAGDTDG